jgi:collagenase-like PrtC family protease
MKAALIVISRSPAWHAALKEAGADEIVYGLEHETAGALESCPLAKLASLESWSLLLDRLYPQKELPALSRLLQRLAALDLRSLYFSDPAVFSLAPQALCSRLIYKPDTLLTSGADAAFWMRLGLRSVSVSPLLTRDEIMHILRTVPGVEIMVHGRLLLSRSRRRLLSRYAADQGLSSSLFQDRSLQIQEETRDYAFPIYENFLGTTIYSDFVQENFAEVPGFVEAGAARLLVDGTLCPPQETLDAVRLLHRLITGEAQEKEINSFFSQYADISFSKGFYGQKTIL